jgi:hypothetical protein
MQAATSVSETLKQKAAYRRKPGPMAGGFIHGRIQQKWFSGFASEFAQFKQSLNGGLPYAYL